MPRAAFPKPVLEPMEARAVAEVPVGAEWQYEPKWDGFRCIAFRQGGKVYLQSKSGQPLGRYFPELVGSLLALPETRFVLDAEIVVPVGGRLSFDDLLQRVHPAASRVRKLAKEHPAMLVVFDLLADERGSIMGEVLEVRRERLEAFAERVLSGRRDVRLSPAATEIAQAREWFAAVGGNLDGIVAKRRDMPYRSGERDGMVKVKHRKTADCVVGGFRYATGSKEVGSLLLGLYSADGKLHHVGFTSSFKRSERRSITARVVPLKASRSFTGRTPGGPSRWSTERSSSWQPVSPKLVVEVEYDHVTGERFRHGTRLVRWRADKRAKACTFEQLGEAVDTTLALLDQNRPRPRERVRRR